MTSIFSHFLNDMGEYRKAEKFLLRFLKVLKKENMDVTMCYHALGRLAHGIDDYDAAVSYQEVALDMQKHKIPRDFYKLALIYNHLAEGYCIQKRSDLAVTYNDIAFECSLKIDDLNYRNRLLSNCYHTNGKIQMMKQHCHQALQSLNISLDLQRRCYPSDHPFVARIYVTIGKTYSLTEENDAAIKMFRNAKDIFLKSLPVTHPYIGELLYDIGCITLNLAAQGRLVPESENLQTNFTEAYDIFHHSLPARSSRFLLAKETLEKISVGCFYFSDCINFRLIRFI